MNNLKDNKRIYFSIIQFLFWAAMASQPYVILFYQKVNLTNTQIGTIFAVSSMIRIISQPFWGFISDKLNSNKIVLVLCISVSTVFYFLISLSTAYAIVFLFVMLNTVFSAPILVLIDSWCIHESEVTKSFDYGQIRIWGSISFAIIAFVYGFIFEKIKIEMLFIFMIVFLGLLVFVVILYEEEKKEKVIVTQSKNKNSIKLYFSTFRNHTFIIFLIFLFLYALPQSAGNSFYAVLVDNVGGATKLLGYSLSLKALLEVPFLILSKRMISKFGSGKLCLIGTFLTFFRILGYALSRTQLQLFISHMIAAPAYSFYLVGSMKYVYEMAPENYKSSYQTVSWAAGNGLGGTIGNYLAGYTIDNIGINVVYYISSILTLLSTAFFAFSLKVKKKNTDMKIE